MDSSRVGAIIREARENKGLSQAKLAQAVEVDPSTIIRAERGTNIPHAFTLAAICDELGLSVDTLLAAARGDS